jgi:hypothetical protein
MCSISIHSDFVTTWQNLHMTDVPYLDFKTAESNSKSAKYEIANIFWYLVLVAINVPSWRCVQRFRLLPFAVEPLRVLQAGDAS